MNGWLRFLCPDFHRWGFFGGLIFFFFSFLLLTFPPLVRSRKKERKERKETKEGKGKREKKEQLGNNPLTTLTKRPLCTRVREMEEVEGEGEGEGKVALL